MSEYTASLARPSVTGELAELRNKYKESGVPVILDESLNALLVAVKAKNPRSVLEIGTAVGLSGIAILCECDGRLTTIETDSDMFTEAEKNFAAFGLTGRVRQFFGDAGEVIDSLGETFDLIFLDGPKAHYLEYYPRLKAMLNRGGVLVADNVLFRGYVDPSSKFPRRFITIVKRMRKFLAEICSDGDFITTVSEAGDGILIAVRR